MVVYGGGMVGRIEKPFYDSLSSPRWSHNIYSKIHSDFHGFLPKFPRFCGNSATVSAKKWLIFPQDPSII
jgi:hypothetical protein